MSPGLFRACQGLLASLQEAIVEVASERPDWRQYEDQAEDARFTRTHVSEEEELAGVAEFKEAVDQRARGQRRRLIDDYETGEREGWSIRNYPEREEVVDELEVYSDDTYLALDSDSVLMGPLRRA